MKQKIILFVACIGLFFPAQIFAQFSPDLRINEIQAMNKKGPIDQYGNHIPWIEIFNTAYNSINMSGLYLTNDFNNLTKYKLPKDARFIIPQRSYLVFYCDSTSNKGDFHCNFKLDSSGFIALVDANGYKIIDSVSYTIKESDMVYMRKDDGEDNWIYNNNSTAMQANNSNVSHETTLNFIKYDPIGIGMAIISMFVVMTALLLSYLTFKYASRLYRNDLKKSNKTTDTANEEELAEESISGEVGAAIALSIHIYVHQMHDLEDTIITIRKISKTYSPWSSKLYMQRPWPQKKQR